MWGFSNSSGEPWYTKVLNTLSKELHAVLREAETFLHLNTTRSYQQWRKLGSSWIIYMWLKCCSTISGCLAIPLWWMPACIPDGDDTVPMVVFGTASVSFPHGSWLLLRNEPLMSYPFKPSGFNCRSMSVPSFATKPPKQWVRECDAPSRPRLHESSALMMKSRTLSH